jgi:hypothetical protein
MLANIIALFCIRIALLKRGRAKDKKKVKEIVEKQRRRKERN